MEFRFAPLSLPSLDGLKTEVLCLPVFGDERPLRGARAWSTGGCADDSRS